MPFPFLFFLALFNRWNPSLQCKIVTDHVGEVQVEAENFGDLGPLKGGGECSDDHHIRQDGGDNRSSDTEGIYRARFFLLLEGKRKEFMLVS